MTHMSLRKLTVTVYNFLISKVGDIVKVLKNFPHVVVTMSAKNHT